MSQVAQVKFFDYESSIAGALDLVGAGARLPQQGLIIIKPNLTNSSAPPVTTDVAAAEAVYRYCKAHTKAEIAIGDGCGRGRTADLFAALGYTDLAKRCGLELIDFNEAETVTLENKDALQLKRFCMPRIVQQAFIISLPVLKDHSFTKTTIAMKNMFGIAPGKVLRRLVEQIEAPQPLDGQIRGGYLPIQEARLVNRGRLGRADGHALGRHAQEDRTHPGRLRSCRRRYHR